MKYADKKAQHTDETVPVLIVGGSLVGLSTSLFLSQHDIPALLVERHQDPSPHPRASGFNQRTLELFRAASLDGTILQAVPPTYRVSSVLEAETLVGKELGWRMQGREGNSEISPASSIFLPQNELEIILRQRAQELGGDLRFHTELVSFEHRPDCVRAVIREQLTGEERSIHAHFLIAADGHRSPIRQGLGIATRGHGKLGYTLSIMFQADLRRALGERCVAFCFINNVRGSAALRIYPSGQQGILNVARQGLDEQVIEEDCIEIVRSAIGILDLDIKILDILQWELSAWVAERFQQGRIFLVGDSAHVMPPTGGFGANTGIADAHNLAWKLALVLKEKAGISLLDTYESERRPVAQVTVEHALVGYRELLAPRLAGKPTAWQMAREAAIFGYHYNSTAVLSSETEKATMKSDSFENPLHTSGRPGTRAPHIPLERDGEQLSTLDLFGRHFVLLTGENGEIWWKAAQRVAGQLSLELDVYRIGDEGQGECLDVDGRFLEIYGLTKTGAVLVRPDGFIGWRVRETASSAKQCEHTLANVLVRLLSRNYC